MKKYFSPLSIIYWLLTCMILNSYTLIERFPIALVAIIPVFILVNVLAGVCPSGTKSLRLRICNHGSELLAIFICSLIPSLLWHTALAFILLPDGYLDFILSIIFCVAASAILFWNGIICVYLTSTQLGIKWRVIGALCGFVPILNLIVLKKMIDLTSGEVEYEVEREAVTSDPALSELCKTKYPIVLVHGIFFRDSKIFNYWGRIPRTLILHGATVYYGEHQSALPIRESGRELASRIKLIVDRYGCEKVNIIAHSKGGLDCRYAISEFGLSPYVASLTTVSTPHRGCVFVEKLLYAISEKVKNKVARAYNTTLTALGDECPDFLEAVKDLTAESCAELNKKLTLPDGIYTQSVGSVMTRPKSGRFPLNLSYRYVKDFDGENDGLVGESSFAFGENYTLLRTEDPRGISHADMIDLCRENFRGFDVRDFYTRLVSDLRQRGL